ncbi:MAG: ATP-dependent RecD-like DNA helicase [Tenericutes bacterium]|nr:ATP-dependent RecD-like DNA helicase [Mycoplasmatota bacterium]
MSENYIKGNVVKILYQSSTGYKVGLFKVKEALGEAENYLNKTLTFTGNFMPLNNELTYKFTGYLINHARFGVQFNVTSYESVVPSNIDGLVMYLSSGIFKGIGPKTAKAIVDVFKEETIYEIKNGNPVLAKIKGMTLKKASELTKKINEYDKDQELILEFNKMGFTTEECLRIVNKYKNRCFDIINNNIYLLENDINFLKLDNVFLKMHEENELVRVNALIKYVIKNLCYETGNTIVSTDSVFLNVNKYFSESISSGLFLNSLDELISNDEVIKVNDMLTLEMFYSAERNIADTVKNLLKRSTLISEEEIDNRISVYEEKNKITFNDEQKSAIKGSLINNFFIITGGPGTGKTTIIKAIVDIYEDMNFDTELEDITLLAPTGRASKRITESVKRKSNTIHKFLKWNKETKEFSVNRFNPSFTKLVIVDEASMIDIFLFNSLLDALRENVKLILVGDKHQLPSIAPGNVLGDLLNIVEIPKIYLEEIYRTKKDSYIIPLANQIKNKVMFNEVPPSYSDFKFINSPDILIKKYLEEVIIKARNKKLNIDNFQVLIPMYKGENGIENINRLMQDIFNPRSMLRKEIEIKGTLYREGDKVLQLVNDVDNNIYNGDVGYIKRITLGSSPLIDIEYTDHVVNYKRGKFEEFTLAYAVSVHKSQGSEYDNVILVMPSNMKRMLYNKLIYTAVTRAKKSLVIIGNLDSFNYSVQTDYSENRKTSLNSFF